MTYPPTRISLEVETPSGRTFRWGEDEPDARNAPRDLEFSTTIPGGFEELTCSLTRKASVDYADLAPLSSVRVNGAGGEKLAEFRLESTPRAAGNELAITPSAVGWQAALEDNANCSQVFVDRDLSNWQTASAARREFTLTDSGNYDRFQDGSVENDGTTGIPEVRLTASPPWDTGIAVEQWYDAGPGNAIASISYDYVGRNLSASWLGRAASHSDDVNSGAILGTDVVTGATPSGTATETWGTAQRYNALYIHLPAAASSSTSNHDQYLRCRKVVVWGSHGLTKRGTYPDDGLYASDIIAWVVQGFAPALFSSSTGPTPSIQQTSFVIPTLAFREGTTALEMISGADRFHHWDWAVWEGQRGPTFYYYPPGSVGKRWRTRVGPGQLQETGQDVSRVWNGVIVQYQDVDGQALRVGPPGSQVNSSSSLLLDSDPENPANQAGITRYATFDMNEVSTAAAAVQVGSLLLQQYKLLDQSGSASLTGWVEDSGGRAHPVSKVRAGDYISFMDASDSSYRRIVRTNYNAASVTNAIDLGAPPEGLDALLERQQVSIVSLGV